MLPVLPELEYAYAPQLPPKEDLLAAGGSRLVCQHVVQFGKVSLTIRIFHEEPVFDRALWNFWQQICDLGVINFVQNTSTTDLNFFLEPLEGIFHLVLEVLQAFLDPFEPPLVGHDAIWHIELLISEIDLVKVHVLRRQSRIL